MLDRLMRSVEPEPNTGCVNPAHLRWGTRGENVRDMIAKGRNRHPRGSRSPRSRLTEAQVVEMRQRYAAGGVTHRQLAAEYGVNHGSIARILSGEYWRHVP